MIPTNSQLLTADFQITMQPTKTWQMDFERERVTGNVDGLEAMEQAIFKILNTERYQYRCIPGITAVSFWSFSKAGYICLSGAGAEDHRGADLGRTDQPGHGLCV